MSKTIKEFSEVVNLSIKMLEAPKNVLEFEKYDVASSNIDCVIALLKNLQPPKPPTCGTCDYVSPVYSLNSDGEGRCIKSMSSYRCKKVTCLRLDSFGDEDPIGLPLSNFGCNSHSDYGVPDETK